MGSVNFNVGFLEQKIDRKGYKFKDFDIPVGINNNNYDIKALKDLNCIKNSIDNIFHWFRGERILNPLFGNPILEFIYEPINDDTSRKIGVAIKNAIESWDYRIIIQNMSVIPNEDQNQYNIEIVYDVPIMDLREVNYSKTVTLED